MEYCDYIEGYCPFKQMCVVTKKRRGVDDYENYPELSTFYCPVQDAIDNNCMAMKKQLVKDV